MTTLYRGSTAQNFSRRLITIGFYDHVDILKTLHWETLQYFLVASIT
jgi:hypothetical protein